MGNAVALRVRQDRANSPVVQAIALAAGDWVTAGFRIRWHRFRLGPHSEIAEPIGANLNRALAFSGLAVDAAGELVSADHVKTLPEAARRADELRANLVRRGVHAAVLRFCRAELVADNYFHAVLEAGKSIADKLRDDGGKLAAAAKCSST